MSDWADHWRKKMLKIEAELDKGCVYIERIKSAGPPRIGVHLPYTQVDCQALDSAFNRMVQSSWRSRTKSWIVPLTYLPAVLSRVNDLVGANKVICKGLTR